MEAVRHMEAIRRMEAVRHPSEEIRRSRTVNAPGSPEVLISAKGVQKFFNGMEALRDITLEVRKGEFVFLLGPSGCGKSTFLNLVAGYLPLSGGTLTFRGKPIEGPSVDRVVVFQDYALFEWRTVLGNVAFGLEMKGLPKKEREERARHYIALVGLKGFEHKYPFELSGGMKQRVAIARALAVDPEVLLLDEPFGALDAQTRLVMQDELLRIWEETHKTIVFVTHSIDESLRLGDRVFVFTARPGRVKQAIDVPFARPRNKSSKEYLELHQAIEDLLRDEVLASLALERTEG